MHQEKSGIASKSASRYVYLTKRSGVSNMRARTLGEIRICYINIMAICLLCSINNQCCLRNLFSIVAPCQFEFEIPALDIIIMANEKFPLNKTLFTLTCFIFS